MDERINGILRQAADAAGEPAEALVSRITQVIGPSVAPVRVVSPVWFRALLTAAISVVVGIGGAWVLGLGGFHKFTAAELAVIAIALTVLVAVTAFAAVREMSPGQFRLLSPGALTAAVTAALLIVFAILFQQYGWVHFLSQGLICLRAGIIHAAIAAALMWLVLRRSYAVQPEAAGLLIGTVAGLAGVTMLELHCTDFQAQHVLVWHTAVLPCSSLLGVAIARLVSRRYRYKED